MSKTNKFRLSLLMTKTDEFRMNSLMTKINTCRFRLSLPTTTSSKPGALMANSV